jgi:hypothetical protein
MTGTELERWVKLDRLPSAITIEANDAERAALARRFSVPAITRLCATVTLAREGDAIEARGRLEASLIQLCAVSGERFDNALSEPLAIRFVPALAEASEDEALEFAAGEPDEIEYQGAAFDLGEAVAQSFGLALDPYATGPAADRARQEAGITGDDAPAGPFAALAALRPSN